MAVSISISVAQNSQSTSNNTSNITAEVTAHWTEGSYNLTGNASGSITIDGTKYDFGQLYFNADHTNAGSQVIMTKTVNVKHNSDGTKNLTVSAAFQSGVSSGLVSTKVVRTLTTIPRTSTPTLSSDSVDMGAKVTITTNRKSSSFTHNLAYSFEGGDYVSFATGVGASYEWTTPDLASLIPNATSGTLVIRCITKNGSSTVGTKTVSMTLKVPETVVPTIPTVSVVETTAGVAAQFGGFVKGKSAVKVTITASGAKGSTIKSYHSTLDGYAYDSVSFTTPILMGSGTLNLVVKVTDSRGRTGTETVPLVMLGYSSPAISALQVYRVNSAGAEDPDGTYIAVRYAYSVQPLNNKNTASMVLEYKRTIDSSWSRLLTGTALSADTTAKPTSPTFSIDYQYDIRMTVTDWFGSSAIYPATLPSGAVVFDIKADGKGFAFFTTANREGVDMSATKVYMGPDWQTAVVVSPFGLYSTSQPVQYKRFGDLVEVRGVIKPTVAITYDSGWNTITTLPEGFRPGGLTDVEVVCQGGGNAVWLMRVTRSGAVQFSRYRDGSTNTNVAAGARLPFSIMFMTD